MACVNELYIVSYNMHGFNQGIEVVSDLANSNDPPDIILLQEHWLTPANLFLFGEKLRVIMPLANLLCLTVLHRVH